MKPASGLPFFSRPLISASHRHNRRFFLFALGGVAGSWSLNMISPNIGFAQTQHDLAILNGSLELEDQAIWAYTVASGKLSNQSLGKTILAMLMINLNDHQHHRELLSKMIHSLGATPVSAQDRYDLSAYIEAGEGNFESDLNIAKLALSLEYDLALAYINGLSQLSRPELAKTVGAIGQTKSAHMAAIRSILHTQDPSVKVIPSAIVSADTRDQWILQV